MSTDEHVASYYEALKAGDLANSAELVPKADPYQTREGFAALFVGYEMEDDAIFESAESSESGETKAFIVTPDDGVWNTAWEFAETAIGLVVKDLTYSRPGRDGLSLMRGRKIFGAMGDHWHAGCCFTNNVRIRREARL